MTIFKHSIVRLLIIVFCAFISLGTIRSLWNTWHNGEQIGERRSVLKSEQEKHGKLSSQLSEATSSAFVEREARNKLGLVRDGETVILMGTPAVGDDQLQNVPHVSYSRWQLWWRLFF
jgi:cell division protein FtsB